jgi:Raf kinase inhibitor-like YbhB/YbcL family protein
MTISSKAFTQGGAIPSKYTCDGKNVSPPLAWEGAPASAKCLALIMDDPDAPGGDWVHWVVFHLPTSVSELAEHVPPLATLPEGGVQGRNDFKKLGYGGPCPPSGTHRYFFRLYALNSMLPLRAGATRKELDDAMRDIIITKAELMGTYARS